MEPVLNECSLVPAGIATEERMATLVSVLRGLDALGFPRVIRHTRDARNREVETGRSLHEWLFRSAPKEIKLFVAGRMSRAPYVEDLHNEHEGVRQALFQATHGGEAALGPCVAYLLDAPAVALRGVAGWEADPLRLTLSRMGVDGDEITERTVDVVHLSSSEQVAARAPELRKRVLQALSTGDELWVRRNDMFPHLAFCAGVEAQIRSLTGNEFYFQQVVGALSRLQDALERWSEGAFHPGMDHSFESKSTLEHGTFGPMRDFACPDARLRRFSNHLKLFSSNWRIYYWEHRTAETGARAFVGYVGSHLPTVRYRT